jgi:hypothetical protein
MRICSILLVAAVSVPAACSDDGGEIGAVGSDRPVVTTSVPSQVLLSPVGIGDATFERVVSRDDAIEAGFDPEMVDELMGDRGVVQFTITFEGPRFFQYQRTGDGPPDLGEQGAQYIDDDGHLVWVGSSPGGRGAASVLDWTLEGDDLTLTCLAGCRREDPPDASGNLVMEGTWTKTG